MDTRIDLKDMTVPELASYLAGIGEKAFRAKQLYEWMHEKLVTDFDEMSNLSQQLRKRLKEETVICHHETVLVQTSAQDGTQKYLFRLADGNCIESVWMKYRHGNSVCISSQVGCRQGCAFCASTLGGLVRSLTAAEMLEQVYEIIRRTGERVSNIVVMGIGEPLDNYDALVRFLRMISDEKGQNISQRSLTVSTCGLVPEMKRLAGEGLSVTLALSLHAVNDEKRRKIMPVARRYPIRELMEACDVYFQRTGRRISFEYALIAGVNDAPEDAEALGRLARPRGCHINLIPVNPVTERGLKEPDRRAVEAFRDRLVALGVNATIRRELGRDIDGACGQLRRKEKTGAEVKK